MPRFSLIVPIYNVEAYLPQCLDSIRAQTFDDFEVICIIDGSRDRSEAIARLFAQVDDRIRVICKENGGLSSARNAGINAAQGDYLFFVDSDDLLDHNALTVVDTALAQRDAEVVTFGAETWPKMYNNTWVKTALSPSAAWYESFDPKLVFDENSHPYVWRTVVKRSMLEEQGLAFDETLAFGEDQVFHFQLYPRAKGTILLPDKLYYYRVVRRDSLMAERSADAELRVGEHVNIVDRIVLDWEQLGILDTFSPEMIDFTIDFLQDDIVRYGSAENGLVMRYRELLGKLTLQSQEALEEQWPEVREMAETILSADFSAEDDAYLALRQRYMQARHIGEQPNKQRPKWQDKLRLVMPMTALALEERINTVIDQTDAQYIQWCVEDAAACARSLELLQVELAYKNAASADESPTAR